LLLSSRLLFRSHLKVSESRDTQLAMFVAVLGMSPTDYWGLTPNQANEIVKAYNKAHK